MRASVHEGVHLPHLWLPHAARLSEHLPRSEADDFAKDVFHSRVKRVRASIPDDLQLRP